jgi:hypothetical protein
MVHTFPDFALGVWRHLRSERRPNAAWSLWDNVRDCFHATHLCRRLGARIKFGCIGLSDKEHSKKVGCCMVKLLGEQMRREEHLLDHINARSRLRPSLVRQTVAGLLTRLGLAKAKGRSVDLPSTTSIHREVLAQSLASPLSSSAIDQQQKQTTKNLKHTKRYQAMMARRLSSKVSASKQLAPGSSQQNREPRALDAVIDYETYKQEIEAISIPGPAEVPVPELSADFGEGDELCTEGSSGSEDDGEDGPLGRRHEGKSGWEAHVSSTM